MLKYVFNQMYLTISWSGEWLSHPHETYSCQLGLSPHVLRLKGTKLWHHQPDFRVTKWNLSLAACGKTKFGRRAPLCRGTPACTRSLSMVGWTTCVGFQWLVVNWSRLSGLVLWGHSCPGSIRWWVHLRMSCGYDPESIYVLPVKKSNFTRQSRLKTK